MLESLFTSRIRVRILSFLLFSPEAHVRKIARETGAAPIQASKELKRLEKAGIVTSRKMANLTLYSAASACPFLEELRRIFIKTEYVADYFKEQLRGADFALIYGSFAQGNITQTSDIDLLIIGDIDRKGFDAAADAAERTLGREVNPVIWTREQLGAKKQSGFVRQIISGPIIMIKGEEKDARAAMGADLQGSADGRPGARTRTP